MAGNGFKCLPVDFQDDQDLLIMNQLATPSCPEFDIDDLFVDDYRGGDQPCTPAQMPTSSVELEDEFASFRPGTAFFPSQQPNELHELEKQFQVELQADPVLAASLRIHQPPLAHVPKIEDDISEFRGITGCSGLKPAQSDLSADDLSVFRSALPEPNLISISDDVSEHDSAIRPYSQTTAPGRYGGVSSPIDYTRPQRPSSEGSAMIIDDQKPTRFNIPVQQPVVMEHSVAGSGRHYSGPNREDDEAVQTACMAVMKSQQEAVQQQALIQPIEQAQYGPRPHLKVVSQPQHEQTVLYRSDSAARGVLKDREGKGFPAVMICDYQGKADIHVFASTSCGIPHPFFFVECVDGVGQCFVLEDDMGHRFVNTTVNPRTGMRAIFPKLSVKRYKEKEVKQNFAQFQDEKGHVYLYFIAILEDGRKLTVMSERITMTKKADMQKRRERDLVKGTDLTVSATMAQSTISQPVIKRIIGHHGSHSGGEEICLYGSNFAPDCIVVFSFEGQPPIQAAKATDQMACTSTHLIIKTPRSPVSMLYPYPPPRIQVPARIYVINPSTCAQNLDSDANMFMYCE